MLSVPQAISPANGIFFTKDGPDAEPVKAEFFSPIRLPTANTGCASPPRPGFPIGGGAGRGFGNSAAPGIGRDADLLIGTIPVK